MGKAQGNNQMCDRNSCRIQEESKNPPDITFSPWKDVKRTEGHKTQIAKTQILKEMNQKVGDARQKWAKNLVGEVENAKGHTRKQQKVSTWNIKRYFLCITIKNNVCVSQLQEAQKIIEQHFMKHFNKETSIISRSLLLEQRDSIGK